jgi:hypothetical protein
MSLLKNSVAENYSSPGWEKSRKLSRSERKADRANRSGVKPDGAKAKSPAFAEDFMLEHSSSGIRLKLIVVPSTTGAGPHESHQSSECFGFPS